MKIPRSSRGLVIISPPNRLDEISRYSPKIKRNNDTVEIQPIPLEYNETLVLACIPNGVQPTYRCSGQ